MFYLRPEGGVIRTGFNFYPWKERTYSIGVVLKNSKWNIQIRLARKVKILYIGTLNNPWRLSYA